MSLENVRGITDGALVKPKGPIFNRNFSRLENNRVPQFYHVKLKSEDKRPNPLSERTL